MIPYVYSSYRNYPDHSPESVFNESEYPWALLITSIEHEIKAIDSITKPGLPLTVREGQLENPSEAQHSNIKWKEIIKILHNILDIVEKIVSVLSKTSASEPSLRIWYHAPQRQR